MTSIKAYITTTFCFLLFTGLFAQSTEFWGVTYKGGDYFSGTIFMVDTNGSNQEVKHSFTNYEVRNPNYTTLCEANNGNLYGLASEGSPYGVIFEYNPTTGIYKKRHEFNSNYGFDPEGSLILASNGKLYGMTAANGSSGNATIFEYDPDSNIFTHKKYLGTQVFPKGSLLQANNGKLYGMTYSGGSNGYGMLFEYDYVTNTLVTKVNFSNNLGKHPRGSLMQASNGKLYGMTDFPCSIIEYDIINDTCIKKTSINGSNGVSYGSLIEADTGRLYGMTEYGGVNDEGMLYEYNFILDSLFIKVHFDSATSGSHPHGDVLQLSNGKFLGMTKKGGTHNLGVLFEYDTLTNMLTKKVDFNGNGNGSEPMGSLMESSTGEFYGLTHTGGNLNLGVLFKYDTLSNTVIKKLELDGTQKGVGVNSELTQASNGRLYGVTNSGGKYRSGVIYEFDPSTNIREKRIDFDTSSYGPSGGLVLAANNKLYGTTYYSGYSGIYQIVGGTLFEYDPVTHTITHKVNFDNNQFPTGTGPKGTPIIGTNGKIYGVCNGGYGNIYEYDYILDNFTLLHSMTDFWTGYDPGALMQASNGLIYGCVKSDTTYVDGRIFSYNLATNTYTVLVNLNTVLTGVPTFAFVEAPNGKLYATSRFGGLDGKGSLLEYDPLTNTVNKKWDFLVSSNPVNMFPLGSLTLGSNGKLFGTTMNGGVFEYDYLTDTLIQTQIINDPYGRDVAFNLTEINSCYTTGDTIDVNECFSYTVPSGDETYITQGSYTVYDTLVNSCGEDSLLTINLNISTSFQVDTVVACDSLTWVNGITYTANNNTAIDTLINAYGCDSIVLLNLTIINSSASIDTLVACDSLTWINGVTYFTSNNTAQDTLLNFVGCDSIVTLNLTVLYPSFSIDTLSACDSLTWINGVTYTSNNYTATDTLINAVGCDSIITLSLTINSNTGIDTLVACDSLTWIDGVTYYSSNITAMDTLVNSVGCDSIVTLNLTILNSTFSVDTLIACDSLTWINGDTYYSSNSTAMDTLVNSVGCDSIITLNLTIFNSTFFVDTLIACDSLTWIDGVTYYSSNSTATDTLVNSAGCDSIITLNLTVNYSFNTVDTVFACENYTWINGVTYTSSNNTAVDTLNTVQGCDSVVTLDLTISNLNSIFTYVNLGSANFSFTNSSTGNFTNSHWAFGDGSTSTTFSTAHHYSNNGTYVVVLAIYDSNVVGDSCISYFMDTISVTAASNSTSCNAGWVIYTDSSSGGVTVVNSSTGTNLTYHWDFGDGDTSNLQFPSHTYASNGPFNLCLTINDGNGCSDSYCDSISANGVLFKNGFDLNVVANYPLGIQNAQKESEVKIYPNPTSHQLNIESENFEITKILILDNTGKVVKIITSNFEVVNVESLATGVYHIELIGEGEVIKKKFVKQ